ncbi:hypothetical protein JOF28_000298 [Leucobacter exalbidus]|uniref:Uncharacterized protein n=1 Tax=Leucobacter exalbidus TaxID=662960 RepID=A0A940T4K9_9MICO|nr:hypothetical protein [Leucobacter exalbidus]
MWKLIFGGIVVLFVAGFIFFAGYVVGTTVSPLNVPSAAANVAGIWVSSRG